MIFTFYSFKGGVGRSMTLANISEILYKKGLNVLIVDFDLEAPGLDRYFADSHSIYPSSDLQKRRGLIDMIISYKRSFDNPSLFSNSEIETSNYKCTEEVLSFSEPFSNFVTPIYKANENNGSLSIITAGRRAGKFFTSYANTVSSFDWDDFFDNYKGEQFFEWFRSETSIFDVVLIDSRTGITEMGGVCTYQLADAVVFLIAPNQQNLQGILMMAKNLSNPEFIEKGRRGRELSLIFVPSRIENNEANLLENFAQQFNQLLIKFMPQNIKSELKVFEDLKIPYVPYYSYMENVAAREPTKAIAVDLIDKFQNLAIAMAKLDEKEKPLYKKIVEEDAFGKMKGNIELISRSTTSDMLKKDLVADLGKSNNVSIHSNYYPPVSIPLLTVAMTKEEARSLITESVFEDPFASRMDLRRYREFKEFLTHNFLDDLMSDYGNERDDWIPHICPNKSIVDILSSVVRRLNQEYQLLLNIKSASNDLFGTNFGRQQVIMNSMLQNGGLIVIDAISLFNPVLLNNLKKSGLTAYKNIAIVIIYPTEYKRGQLNTLIEDLIRQELPMVELRFDQTLDSLVEIGIVDSRTLIRWLNFTLPRIANVIREGCVH